MFGEISPKSLPYVLPTKHWDAFENLDQEKNLSFLILSFKLVSKDIDRFKMKIMPAQTHTMKETLSQKKMSRENRKNINYF